LLATKIWKQKQEDERVRRELNERRQAELQMQAEAKLAEKRQKKAQKTLLQDQVRDAAQAVIDAEADLSKATLIADKARETRRRAGDQNVLSPTPEDERLLDEACKDAAQKEQIEQSALNNVNAAHARLMDLRDRLNRFSLR